MSESNSDSTLKSPLASLAAFAQSKGNLFPSFEKVNTPSVGNRLPNLFSRVSFDNPRSRSSPAGAPKEPNFEHGSDEVTGLSVSGKSGGVSNAVTVGLFVLDSKTICCGQIGNSDRFCTLACAPGVTRCDIKSHQIKAPVENGRIYIRAAANKKVQSAAFQSPSLSVSSVGERLPDLLQSELTIKAWNRIFASFENIQNEPATDFDLFKAEAAKVIEAPFTAAKRKRANIDNDSPDKASYTIDLPNKIINGSFGTFTVEEEETFRISWAKLIGCVETLHEAFPSLRASIKKTTMDLEIAIQSVEGSVEMINIDIGNDPGIDQGHQVTSIWSGIQFASRVAQEAQILSSTQASQIQQLNTSMFSSSKDYETLKTEMKLVSDSTLENTNMVHHILQQIQTQLGPILEKLQTQYDIGAGATNQPLGAILHRLSTLENNGSPQNDFANTFGSAPTTTAGLLDLQHAFTQLSEQVGKFSTRYANIEDRLQVEAVTFNGITFGSIRDTVDWVKTNVPGFVHDGFHDVMTLLQTVTEPHIAFQDGMSETYMSQKVGFKSKISAIIAHSFKLELPDIFGKITATSDKTFPLPAVRHHKQWNPQDGVSGVMRYTTENLQFQVESCRAVINHSYDGSKSRELASLMLSESHSFWTRLSTWMNEFYLKLTIVSSCSADEAWLLVSSCVRGIFRELRRVRLCAQNADSIPDKITSTGYFLWGSLQAHRVMKAFLSNNFESHPAITPIVNMHLFQFRVPMSLFKSQKEKLSSLETTVKQLRSDLDRLKNTSARKKVRVEESKDE